MTTFNKTVTGGLSFIGGTNLYPDPNLYPGPDIYPYGGAILTQVNRSLPGVFRPVGVVVANAGSHALSFAAVLQPHVVFLKTSARVFFAASFSTAALVAVRASHTVAKALFGAFSAAGAFSKVLNPGSRDAGGGGFGVPMPDSFFLRYKPTLRRQKVKV